MKRPFFHYYNYILALRHRMVLIGLKDVPDRKFQPFEEDIFLNKPVTKLVIRLVGLYFSSQNYTTYWNMMARLLEEVKGMDARWLPLIVLVFGLSSSVNGQPLPTSANFSFQGRYIVAMSDADMIPSAYIDGKLGPVEGQDALSVIRLDKPVRELKAVSVGVSNSVTGPPSVLDVSPDGRYAVVIETRGQRPTGIADPNLSDLPPGKAVTVIDLADPNRPTVVQRIEGPERAQSISFNADGSLVVVVAQPPIATQFPLTVYRFANGKLGHSITPTLPGWAAGDRLNGAVFHPHQNTLVVLNSTKATLSFVKVVEAGSTLQLRAWGNPVQVDRQPFKAVFAPDGRYVFTNAMYYGDDISGTNSVPASVLSVRLGSDTASQPVHQIVDRIVSGVLSEGLAISPDGRWLATANLEKSSYPLNSPQQGFFASVTLIRLDPLSGLLDRVGIYAFDGMLPESVAFDNSSRFLAVACFDHYDEKRVGGSIDFWRISGDVFEPKRTELVRTTYSVAVPRGVHTLVMVR